MDASILRDLVSKLLDIEATYSAQSHLEQARNAMNNMANSPQEPSYQTAFADAWEKLRVSIEKIHDDLSPAEWDRLSEFSVPFYFSRQLVDKLDALIAANPATPAVIRDGLSNIINERQAQIQHFNSLNDELAYFGFELPENETNQGQVGFKVPRSMFDNNLQGMIDELNFIKRFVRVIAELEGESPDDIEVGNISTSDPVFWFIVAYGVAKGIAKITDWSLKTWKTVEEIRQLRAQTANIGSFTEDEIEKFFGDKIESEIKKSIDEGISVILSEIEDQHRKNELETGLSSLLKQFLARIERGMTVDVKYLPPPQADGDLEEIVEEREEKAYEMQVAASKLVFPRPVGSPVLLLEVSNDNGEQADIK